MKRRTFITMGVAGALVVTSIGIGFVSSGQMTRRRIRARLGDWSIADGELDQFLDAFEASYGTPAPDRDDFMQILVMSTDAFAPDRRGTELKFVRLYGPYRTPCYNPLARV